MKKFRSFIVYIWVLLLPILPQYFKVGKYPVFTYLTAFALGVFFLYLLLSRKKLLTKQFLPILIGYLILFIPYLYHRDFITFSRYFIETFAIYYMVILFSEDYKKFVKLINLSLYACFFICITGIISEVVRNNIYALLENSPVSGTMGAYSMIRLGVLRLETSFGQPLSYALYLTLFSGISLFGIVYLNKKQFYIWVYILIWVNMLLTVSRLPILLFIVLQLILGIFLPSIHRKQYFIFIGMAGLLCLIVLVSLEPEMLSNFINMFLKVFGKGSGYDSNFGANEDAFGYREQLLVDIPNFLRKNSVNSLFGIGIKKSVLFGRSIDNEYLYFGLCYGIIGVLGKYFISIYALFKALVVLIKSLMHRTSNAYVFLFVVYSFSIIVYLVNLVSVAQLDEFKSYNLILAFCLTSINLYRRYNRACEYLEGKRVEK